MPNESKDSFGHSWIAACRSKRLNHGVVGAAFVVTGGVTVSSAGFLQPTSTNVLTNVTTIRLNSFFMRAIFGSLPKKKQ